MRECVNHVPGIFRKLCVDKLNSYRLDRFAPVLLKSGSRTRSVLSPAA
jgi:hypothetical protein